MNDTQTPDIYNLLLETFDASDVEIGRTMCGQTFFDAAPAQIKPPLMTTEEGWVGSDPRLWRVYHALPKETSAKILHMQEDCGSLWVVARRPNLIDLFNIVKPWVSECESLIWLYDEHLRPVVQLG